MAAVRCGRVKLLLLPAAIAGLVMLPAGAGAARIHRVTLRVPAPSQGDISYAEIKVRVPRSSRSTASLASPAAAIPRGVSVASTTITRGRIEEISTTVAQPVPPAGGPAQRGDVKLTLLLPGAPHLVFHKQDVLSNTSPLSLPVACNNVPDPTMPYSPRRRVGSRRLLYVHPAPGLSASRFVSLGDRAHCWGLFSPQEFAWLMGRPVLHGTFQTFTNPSDPTDVGVSKQFDQHVPLNYGVWAPKGETITAVDADPAQGCAIVNSPRWRPNAYVGCRGAPFFADSGNTFAYHTSPPLPPGASPGFYVTLTGRGYTQSGPYPLPPPH